MSDTSEAEGEAPRVRILCAPPFSTTSLHQPTPQFATLLIRAAATMTLYELAVQYPIGPKKWMKVHVGLIDGNP